MALVPLAMLVTVVQPEFVNGGQSKGAKRGSEATEQGKGLGGGKPPSHGKEICFEICV